MTAPFIKLNKNFTVPDYTLLGRQMSFGHDIDGEFKGIEYLHVDCADQDAIWSVVPAEYKKDFCMTVMRINMPIPPHTDSGINTTINFYIKTDNCVTQYYKFKTDQPQTEQVDNQTDGFIFKPADLDKTESFTAQPKEMWLLDVSKPHGVEPQGQIHERIAIALSSSLEYNVVKELLTETGYL